MKLNKKIIALALTLGPALNVAAQTTETFNASVTPFAILTITESTPLNFGEIPFTTGSSCTLGTTDNITGDCVTSNVAATTGSINVAGLPLSTNATVTVTGGSANNLTLVTAGEVGGAGIATTTPYTDASATAITTAGVAGSVDILVGGSLTADADLTVDGTPLTVSYTVTVSVP